MPFVEDAAFPFVRAVVAGEAILCIGALAEVFFICVMAMCDELKIGERAKASLKWTIWLSLIALLSYACYAAEHTPPGDTPTALRNGTEPFRGHCFNHTAVVEMKSRFVENMQSVWDRGEGLGLRDAARSFLPAYTKLFEARAGVLAQFYDLGDSAFPDWIDDSLPATTTRDVLGIVFECNVTREADRGVNDMLFRYDECTAAEGRVREAATPLDDLLQDHLQQVEWERAYRGRWLWWVRRYIHDRSFARRLLDDELEPAQTRLQEARMDMWAMMAPVRFAEDLCMEKYVNEVQQTWTKAQADRFAGRDGLQALAKKSVGWAKCEGSPGDGDEDPDGPDG